MAHRIGQIVAEFIWQQQRKEWVGCDAVILVKPNTVWRADVAVFADAGCLDELHHGLARQCPNLIAIIVKQTDTVGGVMRRVCDFLTCGVTVVWVVDAEERLVSVFRRGSGFVVSEEDEVLTGEDIIPGFRCCVGDLFKMPSD